MAGVLRRGGAHVYVVSDGLQTKVGRTSYPENRLAQLRGKDFPHREMPYITEKRLDATRVEARAHQLLQSAMLPPGHEWFLVNAEIAWSAVQQAVKDVEAGWRFPRELFGRFLPPKRWK